MGSHEISIDIRDIVKFGHFIMKKNVYKLVYPHLRVRCFIVAKYLFDSSFHVTCNTRMKQVINLPFLCI